MAVDAVIFDWGGTLTRWHDIDFHEESLALAQAVVQTADEPVDLAALAPRLHDANAAIWGRSRDHQRSATIDDLFHEAGLTTTPSCCTPTTTSGCRTPRRTPRPARCSRRLRGRGIKVGVLSNTDVARVSGTAASSSVTACST